jgi:hypothetical protein
MGDKLIRKGLAIGIIFLFIGAGVYPAIAFKNKMSTTENISDELIKIPVQL